MKQGYILGRNSPWGYLISVSAKDFERKQEEVRLHFHATSIDVVSHVVDNYRPRLFMMGHVDAIEGSLAPGISGAKIDEPLEIAVDYELSKEEIAALALKGFFNEQYPLQDITLSSISIPCTVPILIFHGAQTPVIQLALKSSDTVATNSTEIGRTLIAEFPEHKETLHMDYEPYTIEKAPELETPKDSSDAFLQRRGLPIETDRKIIPQEDLSKSVQKALDESLVAMEQPPLELPWVQTEETPMDEIEPPPDTEVTEQIVPGTSDYSHEFEFSDEAEFEFGE